MGEAIDSLVASAGAALGSVWGALGGGAAGAGGQGGQRRGSALLQPALILMLLLGSMLASYGARLAGALPPLKVPFIPSLPTAAALALLRSI